MQRRRRLGHRSSDGSSRTDHAFARFCRRGDARALARVFDATANELYRLAWHLVGDRHAAEDLVQATFLAAIEDAASFAVNEPVMPWLCGILAHRARDHRRRGRVRTGTTLPARDDVVDPVVEASRRELGDAVAASVRTLPEPYRQVLLLHLLHELSGVEVAEALGRPNATVRSQIQRGLDLLRRALPVGIAGMLPAFAAPIGLLRVRAAVLAKASGAGAALTVTSLGTLGGMLAMKKALLAAVVALVCLFAFAWPRPLGVGPAPAANSRGVVAAQANAPRDAADAATPAASQRELVATGDVPPSLDVAVRWSDGEPAVDITVRCQPDAPDGELWLRTARTGADGIAHFAALRPGKTQLVGDRGGKLDVVLAATGAQRAELVLPSGVDVSGTVVDPDDLPIAAAEVWLSIDANTDDGECAAKTDTAGTFRLRNVLQQRVLSAVAPGFACSTATIVSSTRPEIVLRMHRAPGTLVGDVFDPSGRPVVGARVLAGAVFGNNQRFIGEMFGRGAQWPSRFASTDAAGQFTFVGMPCLTWPIWVRAPGLAPWQGEVRVAANAATRVRIDLALGARMVGRVSNSDGSGIANAGIWLWQTPLAVDPQIGFEMTGPPSWAAVGTRSGADGAFALEHVPLGKHGVGAHDQHTSTSAEFTFLEGQQCEWNPVLEVLALHGDVVDPAGAPLPGWALDDLATMTHVATCDAHGHFRCEYSQDRLYRLSVHPEDGSITPALTIDDVRPGATPLHIEVPWELVPMATMTGQVTSADGSSAPYCIEVDLLRKDPVLRSLADSEGGKFVTKQLVAGHYRLWASGDSFGSLCLGEWDVQRGEVLDIGVHRVPASGRLIVRVVGSDGRVLPTAQLKVVPLGSEEPGDHHLVTRDGCGSGRFQPGRYLLTTHFVALTACAIEIRAGEDTDLELRVPEGQSFVLRLPTMPPASRHRALEITWRAPNGDIAGVDTQYIGPDHRTLIEQAIPAGHYTVEVRDGSGATASTTADIRAADPPVVVELPLPKHD